MTTTRRSAVLPGVQLELDRLLIDGALVDPGRTYPTINPATGAELAQAPDAGLAETEAAIAAARRAFDGSDWSANPALRARCLRQLHESMVRHQEELRALTIADAGHPLSLTHGPALDDPLKLLSYYAELAESFEWLEPLPTVEQLGGVHRRWVEREAIGVVAAIIAYNYPTQLALAKIAPALAAGCTVILKAAPDTPLITLALAELIHNETDIPAGVVNILTSSSVEVGQVLTTHRDVDMVTFTGSTPVGRQVMAAASETVKRVFLELGGKSALIVLDDADFTRPALAAAYAICSHSGQGCAITSRLLVPRSRYDEMLSLVKANMAAVVVGDPSDPNTYMGPLISAKQRDKVDAIVQRAIAAGAVLEMGGHAVDPGFYYEPTLLTNVDPSSEIAQEELFGPVLTIIPFEDDDDAVRIANDSIYGLAGAVYGTDTDRALAVARRIRTGTMGINGGSTYGPDSPFGGYKQAGNGRESGVAGMLEFLEIKTFAMVEDEPGQPASR